MSRLVVKGRLDREIGEPEVSAPASDSEWADERELTRS